MTSLDRAFHTYVDILLSNAPGIREGNRGAVHDARVATRRLRALLPVVTAGLPEQQTEATSALLRRIGRALGAARDADVLVKQLKGLELRIPSASRAITALRLKLMDRQAAARRDLVKKFERLALDDLQSAVRELRSPFRFTKRSAARARAIGAGIGTRARKLWEDVERAGGVYFPNRTHAVRISAKKLRYLLEFALDGPDRKRTLETLKSVQHQLGGLHDRQTLADLVEAECASGAIPEEYASLLAWVRSDMRRLHEEYAAKSRDALRGIVHRLVQSRKSDRTSAWLAVGAFAAPSVMFWFSRLPPAHPSSSRRTSLPADCAATVS